MGPLVVAECSPTLECAKVMIPLKLSLTLFRREHVTSSPPSCLGLRRDIGMTGHRE